MLSAGQVVVLPAGEPHAVRKLSDTSLLVTVALHAPAPRATRTRAA
jgi:quercetin dioxygenase-like cupin family protein